MKGKIETHDDLIRHIELVKNRRMAEGQRLKAEAIATYDSVKPANLIKYAMHDVTHSEDLKEHLLMTLISVGAGYAAKKVVEISSNDSIWYKILAILAQYGVTTAISRNPEFVKLVADKILAAMDLLIQKHAEVTRDNPETEPAV